MAEWDLPNWLTLLTEIIVGIIIAAIVFMTTKKSEKENKKTLKKIHEIENEQSKLIHKEENFRKIRHDYAIKQIRYVCEYILGALMVDDQNYLNDTGINKKYTIDQRKEFLINEFSRIQHLTDIYVEVLGIDFGYKIRYIIEKIETQASKTRQLDDVEILKHNCVEEAKGILSDLSTISQKFNSSLTD